MKILVSALASLLPETGVPEEIVYIPEGAHTITPLNHPNGITVNMPPEHGERVAKLLQAALDRRLAQNVQPWLDFEHTRKFPASGYPKSFRYEQGRGIIAAVEWSASGSRAIQGRDVRYFSPEFYLDDNGVPAGLPERGPLGGLVTEPAFREIPPVAASDAAEPNQTPIQPAKKMKLLLAALNISPDSADAESAAVAAVNGLKQTASRVTTLETEVSELKGKVTAAEGSLKEVRKQQGESLFQRAVAAGLAKNDDESKKAEFIQAAEADNKLAIKFLTERVVAAESSSIASPLSQPLVTASAGSNSVQGEPAFVTEARRLVTAGQAKDIDEAYGLVAASNPTAYGDYLKTLA